MAVNVIEVIGTSPVSFEEAFKEGVEKTCSTIRNVTGVKVIGQTAEVKDGQVTEYKVNMKVAFVVE